MQSNYFNEDHEIFRKSVREFMQNEVIPFANQWEEEKQIPKSIWRKMGDLGFLGINFQEKYGGINADFFYSVVFLEEIGRCALAGFTAAVLVQQYMATVHINKIGSELLKEKYLVPSITGKKIGALAITEPNAGSDVASLSSYATRKGNNYIINGSKTFITNGVTGDFITLAVKTDIEKGMDGISLIVVDADAPGITTNKLDKMGMHCSDTGELFFDNVKVPASNLIGQENMGFYYLMESFQLERLVAAISSISTAEFCIEETLKYILVRKAFNKSISKFQVIRHALAQRATELEAAKQLTYNTAQLYEEGKQAVKECSMVKLLATELSKNTVDSCLQFFGGNGYMEEYLISRMYRDARVSTIVGGTSEIMREIIAKIMIDQVKYDSVYGNTNIDKNNDLQGNSQNSERNKKPKPITVSELFKTLPERLRQDKIGNWESNIHFDISGDDGGKFTVNVENGVCTVKDGLFGEPKCIVKTKAKTYLKIESGKTNSQTAFMLGKIKVSNIAEMMQYTKMFRKIST